MQILYNNIVQFVDGDYKNETMVYQQFPLPRLYNELELKGKYVYNYIWEQWFDTWSWKVSEFCNETIVYDGKNLFQLSSPYLRDFFKLREGLQVEYVCYFLIVLVMVPLNCLVCICCFCCRKKEIIKVKED